MIVIFDCKQCGKTVRKCRAKGMKYVFCSRKCKGEWQRTQKPATREWLYQKYVIEELDCPKIAKIVKRDPKSVWNWLRDYGIPTRPRGVNIAILRAAPRGPMSTEARARMSKLAREARLRDGRVPYLKNGVHHLKGKRGAETPNWKGGFTPERQAFYGTEEWKAVAKLVRKRDGFCCRRCGLRYAEAKKQGISMDIHHIVSFAVAELRAEPANLVLLCEPCHYWVHSNANSEKEFLK